MTVRELNEYFNKEIPQSLSCEWDNDGLMCADDMGALVHRVLCTLDVTRSALEYAAENGFDTVVSHHPLIFHPLKALTPSDPTAEKVLFALQNHIRVLSFHTRFDALPGGINDLLAEALGLTDVRVFGEEDMGRIGVLPPFADAKALAIYVKTRLNADGVAYSDAGHPIRTVAVLGGAGKDYIADAIAAGADALVTGEVGHHPLTDAPAMGISLIEAGHFFTENAFCADMVRRMRSLSLEAEAYSSNVIRHI